MSHRIVDSTGQVSSRYCFISFLHNDVDFSSHIITFRQPLDFKDAICKIVLEHLEFITKLSTEWEEKNVFNVEMSMCCAAEHNT